jgi:hypothetical protein
VLGVAKSAAVAGNVVTLDLYLENLGNTELSSLSLTEDLDTTFGAGNYTITTAPSWIDDPGTLTLEAAYTGSGANTELLAAGGTLAVGDTAQIQLEVTVTNVVDLGAGVGIYSNQATGSGTGPGGTPTSDPSDDGSDPDPDGDGDPDESISAGDDSDENDPTPIVVVESPVLGVAKSAAVAGSAITLDLYLENLGNTELSSLSLTEDLDATFGAGNYTITAAPSWIDDPGTLTLEAGYTGSGANTELLAAGGTLAVGDTAQIQLEVTVTNVVDLGAGVGVYSNQATGSGTGPGGTPTSDPSDDGTDPDPDGDGDPDESIAAGDDSDENDPTPIVVAESPVLGVAKSAAVAGSVVTLDLYLENLGNTELSSLSLTEDLDAAFGAGNYTITAAPSWIDDPGTLTLEAGYTGSGASTELLAAGGTLTVGDTAQIQLEVTVTNVVDLGPGVGIYSNQATGSGTGPGGTPTSDPSDDGTDPDPDGDGDPDESIAAGDDSDENDPTPIVVVESPVLGMAKSAAVAGNVVTLDLYLENLGNTELSSLGLTEDLDAAFGAGNYTITAAPSLVDDPGTLMLEAGYTGSGANTELLAAGSTLAVGDTAQIQLEVTVTNVVDLGAGVGIYSNQATGSGRPRRHADERPLG